MTTRVFYHRYTSALPQNEHGMDSEKFVTDCGYWLRFNKHDIEATQPPLRAPPAAGFHHVGRVTRGRDT